MARDLFISYHGPDGRQALALKELLLRDDSDLDIFVAEGKDRPLENAEDWFEEMLKEAANSKYLIFIASDPEFLEDRKSYVYREVHTFLRVHDEGAKIGKLDCGISWFGILLNGCKMPACMQLGETYQAMYGDRQNIVLSKGEWVEDAASRILTKFKKMVKGGGNQIAADVLDHVHSFVQRRKDAFNSEELDDDLLPKLTLLGAAKANRTEGEEEGTQQEDNGEAQTPEERSREKNAVNFEGLTQLVNQGPVAILGSKGGCGKTSLVTKLFFHYLPEREDTSFFTQSEGMIPLYVDAKTLNGENRPILRHLARNLYDDQLAVDSASLTNEAMKLSREFEQKTAAPRYLLLIDGYNEIPAKVLDQFEKELQEFLPGGMYPNVRLVITSRYLDRNVQEELGEDVKRLQINDLDKAQVVAYLRKKWSYAPKLPEKLLQILMTPMYLKLYGQTAADTRIESKGDLLTAFVQWQQKKDQNTEREKSRKDLAQMLLLHVLPLLAHQLTMESSADSTYVFTKDTLRSVMEEAQQVLDEEDYGDYYEPGYWKVYDSSGIAGMRRRQLADLAAEYFVKNSKLLRENDDESLEFVHQIYRDYFCARWVSEEMKRSVKKKKPSELLQKNTLPTDVQDFTADLLKEAIPWCDLDSWQWGYQCNDTSVVYRLICQARNNAQGQDQVYVANLVELLKFARNKDLSGCDFSGLDLRRCDLRACQFSRCDEKNTYPTSFAGAALDRENLISDGHFALFVDACSAKGKLATLDRSGTIRIRELFDQRAGTKHVITGVDPRVKKLLFSKTADTLYAMTDHEILEIPIPEAWQGVAEPKRIFETTKRLRRIFLDDEGELSYTTVFNAFNPKRVSDPKAPDVRDFYGLSSVAAVNTTGTQVAYGHVAGYKALRIYDYDAQKDLWLEKKFGVYLLRDGFLDELEQTLKELSLHAFFPDDFAKAREAGEAVPDRGSFFEYVSWELSDRDHDYYELPGLFLDRVYKNFSQKKISRYQNERLTAITPDWQQHVLKNGPLHVLMEGGHRVRIEFLDTGNEKTTDYYMTVELSVEQKQRLTAVRDKWKEAFLKKQQENPLLMSIAGRTIESVDYKDEHTLMVSCIKEYDASKYREKKGKDTKDSRKNIDSRLRVSNTLTIEVDTRDMSTRLLGYYPVTDTERCPMRSIYCDNGILIFSNYLVIMRDYQGNVLARVQSFDNRIQTFLKLRDGGFLACARHFIYRFDAQGNCVASYNNLFEPTNCRCVVDEAGREQLMLNSEADRRELGQSPLRLDIATGCYHKKYLPFTPQSRFMSSVNAEGRKYQFCGEELTVFVDNQKVDGFEVPYKLLVAGCDFRGIRGTMAGEAELCQLSRYGGVTDPLELPVWQTEQVSVSYAMPAGSWTRPEETEQQPYVYREGYSPRQSIWQDNLPGGKRQLETVAWIRIYEDSYAADALEPVDMSILEWTGRLGRLDARMAYHLCHAGMLEAPAQTDPSEAFFEQRMENLYSRYRLLRRTRFVDVEKNELPYVWYTLSPEHGVKLLEATGGVSLPPDGEYDYIKSGKKLQQERLRAENIKEEQGECEEYHALRQKNSFEQKRMYATLDYATRRQLAANRWFCRMADAYPGQLDRFAFFEKFSNTCILGKSATVHGFALVGDQPLFLLVARNPFDNRRKQKTTGMLDSICWLVNNYSHLIHNDQPENLQKPPAVVIIGENYDQCAQLHKILSNVVPEIRKLYTYDALFCGSEPDAPAHFSFDEQGNTYAEDITKLN